jgi:hypothetical protein
MRKPNIYDFPPVVETKDMRIWQNLEIKQDAKLKINKNERIYEIIQYPFIETDNFIKIISKINTKTNLITCVITCDRIEAKIPKKSESDYKKMLQQIEHDFRNAISLKDKVIVTSHEVYKQLEKITK